MLGVSSIHTRHNSCPGFERNSAMAQSKSSWANGKGSHGASNGSSNSLLRILVVMSVALALFALVLQIRESDLGPSTIADEGLIKCVHEADCVYIFGVIVFFLYVNGARMLSCTAG